MIRKNLILISIFSLISGIAFLVFPYFFANLTEAEATNISWLRNIGASISGILFLVLIFIYIKPSQNYDLFL